MLKSARCSTSSTAETPGRSKTSPFVYPLIFVIYLYRGVLAPLVGGNCRFYPSCSHYAEDALRKHGFFTGCYLAARRLLSCHPWHEGGYDPVE
ncbi:MAG: membrane protein insertion efficiency factor YidD [candidate division Zixibacteria bacterium]|nr:membrane protein insertion efficiency factor YidD [candidate division Zixibacteria bacterium]